MAKPTNDPSNYVAVGLQSAKDTEAGTFFFLKHLDGSGFEVDNDVQSEREGGDGQEVGLRYQSAINSDGELHSNARPGVAGRLWAWALGQDSVASDAVGGLHTAAPAASLPYLTVDQRAPVELIERTTNAMLTGITEEWEAGRPLKLTAQFVSGGSVYRRAQASALTATRETTPVFKYPGASVSLMVNDSAGGGATTIKLTKGKVEVKRGVDNDIRTTGLNREDVLPLAFDCDVEATARYENEEVYRNVYYGTGTNALIDLATGTLNLFTRAAGGSYTHRLNVPLLDITGAKIARLDPDGKTVYVDIAGSSRKHASHAVFAQNVTAEPTSYLLAT